ncbi:hypothetical protein GGU11DRAFT_750336 [Lentinula aff. detonsa]|nr:hypothetical protein GGU11DRAFT_750336 [Lentinula aff. detonsa]
MRSGNERIGADQWEMGPGWTGEDTRVGKEYIEDFSKLSDKEWIQLWNSDTFSDTLFGNEAVPAQKAEWAEYRKKAMSVLPICHATNELIDIDEPHHHNYRRMIRTSATRAARRDTGKGGGAKSKKKPGKSAPKPEKKKGKGKDGKDREGDGKDVGGNEAGIDPSQNTELIGALDAQQQEKRIATADKEKDGEQMGQVQEVTLSVFSPPLLTKDLNQSSLQNELDDVNLVLESYTDSLSLPPLVSSFGGLIQYHNSLLAVESHFDLRSRITQQDLLLLKVIIWGKLSLWKADACSFLHDHRGSPAGDLFWFNRLALDIYQWVCVRLQDKEFVPRNYLPQGVSIVDTKPCHLQCFPARIPTDSVEFSVSKAEEWVLGWIGLKGGEKVYVSAFFVYSMVQWLGAPVLAVSRIWKTAQNIPALLLGKTRWSRVSQEEVSAAVVELKKVVEQDTVTPLLVELQKSFFRGRGESDRERFVLLTGLAGEIMNSKRAFMSPEQLFTARPLQPTISTSFEHPSSTTDDSRPLEGLDSLIDQVYLCLALVGDDVSHQMLIPKPLPRSPSAKLVRIHNYLTEVSLDSDRSLPFRECGRSRSRVLASARNPYSTTYLYTVAGLFSAIMVRTILHGTEFLQDHEPFFEDHDHWIRLLKLAQTLWLLAKYPPGNRLLECGQQE